jgi:hypothetical protein
VDACDKRRGRLRLALGPLVRYSGCEALQPAFRSGLRARQEHLPERSGEDATVPCGGQQHRGRQQIAEVGYRWLGGLDQWVMIRSESVANLRLTLPTAGRSRMSVV